MRNCSRDRYEYRSRRKGQQKVRRACVAFARNKRLKDLDAAAAQGKPVPVLAPHRRGTRAHGWTGAGSYTCLKCHLVPVRVRAAFSCPDERRTERHACAQGTPEWLQSRQNRLTGSNFGAAAGLPHGASSPPRLIVFSTPLTFSLPPAA